MKFNLSEQTKRKIQRRIPTIAKNIHEANLGGNPSLPSGSPGPLRGRIGTVVDNVLSGMGRVAAAAAAAGKQVVQKHLDAAGEIQKNTARQIQRDVLDPHFARHLGVSVQEFRRIRDEVPDTVPTPPSTHVRDAAGNMVFNPNYTSQMDRHKAAMEDFMRKQQQKAAVAGLEARNRTLGRTSEQIYGRTVNVAPNPYNVAAPGTPAHPTQVTIGGILRKP